MGNAVIGSLRANLGLDSSKFQKGARGVQDPLKSMKRQFLAVAGAAVAFGGAITAAALRGARQIDEVAKSARRLDASIGGFRAISLAADEAGISLSGLTNDVQTMNRELTRAGEGGPVDDALAKLGLSARELLDLDIDERLAVIADRIQELGFSAGEATAVLQDFGVRNREMALLMVQGGDAIREARGDVQDYGLALNEVDAENIEHANDQLSRLSLVSQYFGQQLALVVVPALGQMAEAFTNSLREGGLLRNMIDGFANNLKRFSVYMGTFVALLGTRLVFAMGAAALSVKGLSASFVLLKGAIARTGIGLVVVGIGELVYHLGLASSATNTTSAANDALASALSGVVSGSGTAVTSSAALVEARRDEGRAALAAAEAELALLAARAEGSVFQTLWTDSEYQTLSLSIEDLHKTIALADAELNGLGSGTPENSGISGLADAVDELDRTMNPAIAQAEALDDALWTLEAAYSTGAISLERYNMLVAQAEAHFSALETASGAALQSLLDRIDPARAGVRGLTEDTATLGAAFRDGRITQEEYNEAIAALPGLYQAAASGGGGAALAIEGIGAAAEDATEKTEGLASTFASAFTDILSGTQSVLGGLAQLAGQLGRMALMSGFEGLFGNLFGGGAGNFLSDLFGFNANGTDNWPGGMSVVGERGPEIVNLPRGSQVFNAQKSAQMMSVQPQASPEVNVNPRIINVLDPSVIGEWMAGPEGETVILNVMRRNGVASA